MFLEITEQILVKGHFHDSRDSLTGSCGSYQCFQGFKNTNLCCTLRQNKCWEWCISRCICSSVIGVVVWWSTGVLHVSGWASWVRLMLLCCTIEKTLTWYEPEWWEHTTLFFFFFFLTWKLTLVCCQNCSLGFIFSPYISHTRILSSQYKESLVYNSLNCCHLEVTMLAVLVPVHFLFFFFHWFI